MRLTLFTAAPLTATADDRVVGGLLLPYGQEGRTSRGRVTVDRGALRVADRVVANLEHDRTRPVGVLVDSLDQSSGLSASFRIAATRAGDDLLTEVREGLRSGLSIEVDDPVIKGGRLTSGTITAVGFVAEPAFPDARLAAALAEDTDATVNDDGSVTITSPDGVVTVTTTAPEPPQEDPAVTDTATDDVTASSPATAPAGLVATRTRPQAPRTLAQYLERVTASFAAGQSDRGALLAALTDITYTAVGADVSEPQWLGELWGGVAYERNVVPQLAQQQLTSLRVNSWKWSTKPEMADYAGNKGPITSNAAATDPVTGTASRLAGGHDIDRAMVDFPESGFWDSYYRAMAESYARLTDAHALAALRVAAAVAPTTPGTPVPGISGAVSAIVDGALAVLPAGPPSYAFVAPDIYRAFLLTPAAYAVDQLSRSLGIDSSALAGFAVVPRDDLTDGDVLVGTKSAATYMELGASPIRVDALNIANGGVDAGVYGYWYLQIHDAAGLSLQTGIDASIPPFPATP